MAEEKNDLLDGQLTRLKSLYGVFSDTDLAKKLGKTQSAISGVKSRGRVPATWIVDAVNTFNVNLQWVATGEGPMRPEHPASIIVTEKAHDIDVDLMMIPMVEAVLSAGPGSFETSATSERKYAFHLDFLLRKGNPSSMVLMRVDGNSMEPDIKSGDVVLIDQSQTALRPAKIYAVGVEDMVFLKIVSARPGKVVLHSLNREMYPPLEFDTREDLAESVRIIGRCVWSCREL